MFIFWNTDNFFKWNFCCLCTNQLSLVSYVCSLICDLKCRLEACERGEVVRREALCWSVRQALFPGPRGLHHLGPCGRHGLGGQERCHNWPQDHRRHQPPGFWAWHHPWWLCCRHWQVSLCFWRPLFISVMPLLCLVAYIVANCYKLLRNPIGAAMLSKNNARSPRLLIVIS